MAAGVDAVQIRERDLPGGSLARLTAVAVAAARGSRTKVLVNDRVDVALAAGADGVHLRADSPPAWRIRPLVPKTFVVGRSVHTLEEARAAGDVDYVIAGTVWPTSSKPAGHPVLGAAGLAQLVRAASVPVLAIGGIDVGRAAAVAASGAAGIAAIGLFIGQDDPRSALTAPRGTAPHDAEGVMPECRAAAIDVVTRALRVGFAGAGPRESWQDGERTRGE